MFATDRDLLVLEPCLLSMAAWVGQRLVSGVGSVSGTALTLSERDSGLLAQGVGAGAVVLLGGSGLGAGGMACEVVSVASEDAAVVSRVRGGVGDAAIGLGELSGVDAAVYTFAPQIADAHGRIVRMLGISLEGEAEAGSLDETAVMNPRDLARLEALGALHVIYAGASAGLASDAPAAQRATMYRERFASERGRVVARLDTDGDGIADASRRPGAGVWARG